ncbi:hypothetical protein AMJ48_00130 [Parcubacteria bacterium DG_74_1]|nr:MAG: hypothetical protein AMJ48_00130 [Parcubacteria bacterium DG_74_1]
MNFNYQARTETGKIQAGVIEASSAEKAVSILQGYGLYVTVLQEAGEVPFYARSIKFLSRVSLKDRVLFSRQLSIMFSAKVPMVESLQTLASQTKNLNFREKILAISNEVEGGTAFSLAIAKYPALFSPFYVAMVRSGEASGKLSEALSYLAEHLEREYHLSGKIKGAMIYPAIVLVVVLIVLALMVFFVIPQLTTVLRDLGTDLPAHTKIAMALFEFFREWGWIFIFILLFLVGSLFWFYRTEGGRGFFDRSILKIPVVGPLLKLVYVTRFAENLTTLISGGLPIAECLEITSGIVGNSIYQKAILKTRDEVRRGKSISQVLAYYPGIFSPVFTQMTLVGERTGTLNESLMSLVNFYQKETERGIENLLGTLEPLIIVFLGGIVGIVIATFLLPIYQLSEIA